MHDHTPSIDPPGALEGHSLACPALFGPAQQCTCRLPALRQGAAPANPPGSVPGTLERDMQTLADAHNPLGMHTLQAERASREAQAKQDREDLELGRRIRELAEKVPGRPVQLCKEHHWSVWVINRGVYSGVSALDAVRLAHKENGGQS